LPPPSSHHEWRSDIVAQPHHPEGIPLAAGAAGLTEETPVTVQQLTVGQKYPSKGALF
jgi:hypothetical protein